MNPTIICLTPVKNEAWILPFFIEKAAEWADYIIIMDQCSTDGTREIARNSEKVILIENDDPTYDEAFRQKTLIEAARKLPGSKKVLFALDADEMLSLNWKYSPEWNLILNSGESTVLKFPWITPIDQLKSWLVPTSMPFAFIDDNKTYHTGNVIHSTRVPIPTIPYETVELKEIGVVHLKLLSKKRNRSKVRWYQVFERINYPQKNPIELYRTYNNHEALKSEEILQNKLEWLEDTKNRNVIQEVVEIDSDQNLWWDHEVDELLQEHGEEFFKKIDIWDILDDYNPREIKDPRSFYDKLIHKWLTYSVKDRSAISTRVVDKILKLIW